MVTNMNRFFSTLIAFVATFALPVPLLAACYNVDIPQNFGDVICIFIDLAEIAIPIVAGIALLVFFWGLAQVIFKADDEDARIKGRQVMIWGIIALFVMVSVWGIVNLLISDFFDVPTALPQLPIN